MPIIADYSGTAISNLFASGLSPEGNVDIGMLRHMILNQIRSIYKKHRAKYGEMIIAYDAGGNWRYKSFPQYKASRKTSRDKDDKDWAKIFEDLNQIKNEIQTIMPYRHIQIHGCEADDIIGALIHEVYGGTEAPVLIVSADKDFKQLQQYSNVRQYSTIQKKFVEEKNPRAFLREQVFRGDKGDGVPNVLSDDMTFVEGRRQTPIRKEKIAEWLDLTEDELIEELGHNYKRNKDMIDLTSTPSELVENILRAHANLEAIPDGSAVLNYFIESKLRNLIGSINDFIAKPNNTNDSKKTTTHRLFT